VRLIDCAHGISPSDHEDLCDWLASWAGNLKSGRHGKVCSLITIIEGENGQLAVISQSLESLDRARIVGLLQIAAHRRIDGGARIEDLTP
jgi:hypothetical protein